MRKVLLKRVSVVLVIVVLMGSTLTYGAPRRTAVVTEVKGTVKVTKSGGERKINAFKGMNLAEGDTLIIGADGQMTLKLDNDKEVILNANTTMNIQDLKDNNGNQVTTLNQTKGSSVTKIDNKLTAGSSFQQRTPTAIMGVRGTVWGTALNEEGTSNMVLNGSIGVLSYYIQRSLTTYYPGSDPQRYVGLPEPPPAPGTPPVTVDPPGDDILGPEAPPSTHIPVPPVPFFERPPVISNPQGPADTPASQGTVNPPGADIPAQPFLTPVDISDPQGPQRFGDIPGPQGSVYPPASQGSFSTEIVVQSGYSLQSNYLPASPPAVEIIDWNRVEAPIIQNFAMIAEQNPNLIDPNIVQRLQNYITENPQVLNEQQSEEGSTREAPRYIAPASMPGMQGPAPAGGGGGGGGSTTPARLHVTTASELVGVIKSNMNVTNNAIRTQDSLRRIIVGVKSDPIDMQNKLQSLLANKVIATATYGKEDTFFVFTVQGMGISSKEEVKLIIFREDKTGELNKNQLYGVEMKYGDRFINGVIDSKTNDITIIVPDDYDFPEGDVSDGIEAINASIHTISYPTTIVKLTGEVIMDEEERTCYYGTFNVNNGEKIYNVTVRKAYTKASIKEFTFEGQLGDTRYILNEDSEGTTIEVYMPKGIELDKIIPEVTTSEGASYTLSSTDFSKPVTCEVTSEDRKSINEYTVRVYHEPTLLTVTVIDDAEHEYEYPISSKTTTLYIPALTTIQEGDPQGFDGPKPGLSAIFSEGSNLREMTREYRNAEHGGATEMTATYKLELPNGYTQDWEITLERDLFTIYPEHEEGGIDYASPLLTGEYLEPPTVTNVTTGSSLYFVSTSSDIEGNVLYDKLDGANPTQGAPVPKVPQGNNDFPTLIFNGDKNVEAGLYRFYYRGNEERAVYINFN